MPKKLEFNSVVDPATGFEVWHVYDPAHPSYVYAVFHTKKMVRVFVHLYNFGRHFFVWDWLERED